MLPRLNGVNYLIIMHTEKHDVNYYHMYWYID